MDDLKTEKTKLNYRLNGIHKIEIYMIQMMAYTEKLKNVDKCLKMTEFCLFKIPHTGHWRGFSVFRRSQELGNDYSCWQSLKLRPGADCRDS